MLRKVGNECSNNFHHQLQIYIDYVVITYQYFMCGGVVLGSIKNGAMFSMPIRVQTLKILYL